MRSTHLNRILTIGFAIIGVLLMSDARAQTEAEAAAASQRELTEAEISRLETDCRLPSEGEVMNQFGNAIPATRVSIPEQRILLLIRIDATDPEKITPFPDLPSGGIGSRDFCERVFFGNVAVMPNVTAVGLRLRPGLDLERDYPRAFAQIQEHQQVSVIPASDFARVDIADSDQAPLFVTALADQPMIATGQRYFLIDKSVYVPLRE